MLAFSHSYPPRDHFNPLLLAVADVDYTFWQTRQQVSGELWNNHNPARWLHFLPVDLVAVITAEGLSLYYSQTNLWLEMGSRLFCGFPAAAVSFGHVLRPDLTVTHLNLDVIRLHFHHGPQIITVLGTNSQGAFQPAKTAEDVRSLLHYQKLVTVLGKTFQRSFGERTATWDGSANAFEEFEQTANLVLGSLRGFLN